MYFSNYFIEVALKLNKVTRFFALLLCVIVLAPIASTPAIANQEKKIYNHSAYNATPKEKAYTHKSGVNKAGYSLSLIHI